MKKPLIILIIVFFMIVILASIFLINTTITGNIIKEQENTSNYMYTKALCNETNYCEDNEISCKGNEIISIIPITGAAVQHSEEWIDPRPNEDRDKIC